MEHEDEAGQAIDWRGLAIRCRECDHFAMNTAGLCARGRACIRDRRARRVDRFLGEHRELADGYLNHPYFEVRACAAQYASAFRLPPLLDDPEPEVRAVTTMRLPADRIRRMAFDPDSRVRVAAAARLEGRDLMPLIGDPEYMVRITAVRHMPPELLPLVRHDPDPEVRAWVARRIDLRALADMAFDADALVRREVAARLPAAQLTLLVADSDMRVRFAVAERIAEEELFGFLADEEAVIRDLARERIGKRPTLVPALAAWRCGPLRLVSDNSSDNSSGTSPGHPEAMRHGPARQGDEVMKVMIRRSEGALSAYVPKKDLEEPIVETERDSLWGGWVKLANGWILHLPDMADDTKLPVTVNARKSGGEEE